MKKTVAIVGLLAVVASLALLPAPAGAAKKGGPVVVATDPADDWGNDPNLAPVGNALGQDLVEASIAMADKTTINFVIKLASLPPSGGVPEASRYMWSFMVNGEFAELDGKFTNYSRGACDPTSGQCPPPRDPGQQPFLIRGNCRPDPNATNVTVCDELGKVQGVFDAAAGTITIPVPLEMISAKPGTKITPGVNSTFPGSVIAIPSAFFSNASMPMDTMTQTKTFVVPKK